MEVGEATRAVVTGASKGIGRALVQALAERGATVGMVARGKKGLAELADGLGERAVPLVADVIVAAEVEKAIDRFCAQSGGIDLLVVNAGIAHYGPFADQDPDFSRQMIDVNVTGVVNTVRIGLDRMLDQAAGQIVIVSSGAGLRAFPGAAVYGATKAFERGLAEALRHELSGTGVSLTTVFPGEVATDLHTHQPTKLPDWRRSDEAIAPEQVAAEIIRAVEHDERSVFVPPAVRLLGLNGIAPRLLDRLMRRARGPSAAPRRD